MNLNIKKTDAAEEGERCCCGRLLAVRVPGGYEIRCSRCKTVKILPFDQGERPC